MQVNLKQDGKINDTHLLDGEFLDLMKVSKLRVLYIIYRLVTWQDRIQKEMEAHHLESSI